MTEKTLDTMPLYQGKVIKIRRDEVELPNGRRSFREVADHPGGVVALPLLEDGRIVMVEQYRYPLGRTLLELPAGKLEPGEPPFESIQRELEEETGYQAEIWEEMGSIYTAPGFCNERLWLYKAMGLRLSPAYKPIDFTDPECVEFLTLHHLTPAEIWEKIRTGAIQDAKTICLFALAFPPGSL